MFFPFGTLFSRSQGVLRERLAGATRTKSPPLYPPLDGRTVKAMHEEASFLFSKSHKLGLNGTLFQKKLTSLAISYNMSSR